MGLGSWFARNLQEAADAEQQSTTDATEVGRGIRDGVRAAVKSYRHDRANETQAQQEGKG